MPVLLAFGKKLHYASEKRRLSYFSNTWHRLGHSRRDSRGTCSNVAFCLHDNGWITFDVFWSHTRWFIVDIRCKSTKSAGSYSKKWQWFQSMSHLFQCIKLKQLYAGIKKYLFSYISSSFRCSLVTDCFRQSLRKHSKTLPEIGSQRHFQKLSLGDDRSLVLLLKNRLHQCLEFQFSNAIPVLFKVNSLRFFNRGGLECNNLQCLLT